MYEYTCTLDGLVLTHTVLVLIFLLIVEKL